MTTKASRGASESSGTLPVETLKCGADNNFPKWRLSIQKLLFEKYEKHGGSHKSKCAVRLSRNTGGRLRARCASRRARMLSKPVCAPCAYALLIVWQIF